MIRIGLGTNDHFHSKLIRRVSGGDYSHAWIEFVSEEAAGWLVLHSSTFRVGRRKVYGVAIVPRERVYKEFPVRKIFECDPDVFLTRGMHWARNRIGAGYDFGVIWNAVLLVLFLWTGWSWLKKKVVRNATRFSCSELVAAILQESNVDGAHDLDPELTTASGDNEGFISLEQFLDNSDDFEELRCAQKKKHVNSETQIRTSEQ